MFVEWDIKVLTESEIDLQPKVPHVELIRNAPLPRVAAHHPAKMNNVLLLRILDDRSLKAFTIRASP